MKCAMRSNGDCVWMDVDECIRSLDLVGDGMFLGWRDYNFLGEFLGFSCQLF
jgi:hypothetical protein